MPQNRKHLFFPSFVLCLLSSFPVLILLSPYLTITLFLSTTSPSHHHRHPPFRPFRLGLLVKWNKHNELTTTRLYLSSLSSQHPVRGARARGHRFLSYRNGFRDMERDQMTRSDETADSKGKSTTIVKTVASGGRVCNQCTSSCRWGLWF